MVEDYIFNKNLLKEAKYDSYTLKIYEYTLGHGYYYKLIILKNDEYRSKLLKKYFLI